MTVQSAHARNRDDFTLSEHAGLCKGGAPLIGASIVVSYARRSLAAGGNAESSTGSGTANWQIDEEQERLALEDMHPANVFIDEMTGKPTCIDCIVKFVSS